MNPIKADKILLGSQANHPNISRGSSSELVFFDQEAGSISLSTLVGERGVDNLVTVSKTISGSDFPTIQEAIDFLPTTGGAIVVYEGVYAEALSTSKPLTLITRGDVTLEATDAPCMTITNTSVRAHNIKFVVKDLAGNSNPSAVKVDVTDVTDEVSFTGCVFDTTNHAVANFLSSSKASIFLEGCRFLGGGQISITGATTAELRGARLPDVSLNNLITTGYLSASQILSLTLIDTSASVEGNIASLTGDLDSRLTKKVVSGVETFVGELEKDIEFECPLSTANYMVVVEPNSQGLLPVVSLRGVSGFRLTYSNALNEDVRWSALS